MSILSFFCFTPQNIVSAPFSSWEAQWKMVRPLEVLASKKAPNLSVKIFKMCKSPLVAAKCIA